MSGFFRHTIPHHRRARRAMTTASMATKPGTASHGRRRWVTVRFARFLRPKKIFGPAAVTQILPFLVYRREAGRCRRVNNGQTGFSSKVQITKPNTRKNESTDNLTCTGGFREERQNQCKLLAETRVQTNLALGRYSDNSHLVESYRDLENQHSTSSNVAPRHGGLIKHMHLTPDGGRYRRSILGSQNPQSGHRFLSFPVIRESRTSSYLSKKSR